MNADEQSEYYLSNIMKDMARQGTMIKVAVKPNSKKTEFLSYDEKRGLFTISVKSAPENNRANLDLIRFLSKILSKPLNIVSGATSKIKLVKVLK